MRLTTNMKSNRRPQKHARRRALTLVELLIVAMVLAIAALLAAPLVGESDQSRLQSAARLLMADLAFAQTESLAHADDPYALRFDHAADTYAVVHDTAFPPFDCSPATTVIDPITNQPYQTVMGQAGRGSQFPGVGIANSLALGGDDCVVFGEFGQTDQSTAATITLTAGAKSITIQIDPVSGEASIP